MRSVRPSEFASDGVAGSDCEVDTHLQFRVAKQQLRAALERELGRGVG